MARGAHQKIKAGDFCTIISTRGQTEVCYWYWQGLLVSEYMATGSTVLHTGAGDKLRWRLGRE